MPLKNPRSPTAEASSFLVGRCMFRSRRTGVRPEITSKARRQPSSPRRVGISGHSYPHRQIPSVLRLPNSLFLARYPITRISRQMPAGAGRRARRRSGMLSRTDPDGPFASIPEMDVRLGDGQKGCSSTLLPTPHRKARNIDAPVERVPSTAMHLLPSCACNIRLVLSANPARHPPNSASNPS